MAFLKLAVAGLCWRPMRTLLTSCSIIIAFMLIGLLEPVVTLFEGAGERQTAARWWVSPKHSISEMLPVHYQAKIASQNGVALATHITWFGGEFRDPVSSAKFTRWAVDAESFLAANPQIKLPEEQHRAFVTRPTAAIVGRSTAEQFNLTSGQTIPLTADIWHNRDGSEWQFDLVGVYDDEDGNSSRMFLNYKYFDEYRIIGNGLVSNVIFTTNGSVKGQKIAEGIDDLFANSVMETKTATESDYFISQVNQLGNVALVLNGIMIGVAFTILMLAASTISQSVRERRTQLCTLKAIGFTNIRILTLLCLETFVLIFGSAALGLACAFFLLPALADMLPQVDGLILSATILLETALIAGLMAIVVGLPPALRIFRLTIADGLRG